MTKTALILATLICIWDRDTINDELRGLPDAASLLTGRWFRHGEYYYLNRTKQIPDHLKKNPDDLGAYDDLAVAYERLGLRGKAIETMAGKAEALNRKPDKEHQYRYHANLGTFYAHSGRFDEAVVELEKAIQINPDAHFGRERFQIEIIKYVAAAKKDPSLWAKHNCLSWNGIRFANSLTRFSFTERSGKRKEDWNQMYTAVAGMLRFGGLEGPELYRTLGDLHLAHRDLNLAWWAFQRALDGNHPAPSPIRRAIASIEKHWEEAKFTNIPTEADFRAAAEESLQWVNKFKEAEKEAIDRGEDPGDEKVLSRIVESVDREVPSTVIPDPRAENRKVILTTAIIAGAAFLLAALILLSRKRS